jgi:hypothetical protein
VGNGTVSARTAAAPASQPESNTAIHPARRMPAMSLSAVALSLDPERLAPLVRYPALMAI